MSLLCFHRSITRPASRIVSALLTFRRHVPIVLFHLFHLRHCLFACCLTRPTTACPTLITLRCCFHAHHDPFWFQSNKDFSVFCYRQEFRIWGACSRCAFVMVICVEELGAVRGTFDFKQTQSRQYSSILIICPIANSMLEFTEIRTQTKNGQRQSSRIMTNSRCDVTCHEGRRTKFKNAKHGHGHD